MSRPSKLTKWNLENGIVRYRRVVQIAEELGVAPRTVYDALKRFGIDRRALLESLRTNAATTRKDRPPSPIEQKQNDIPPSPAEYAKISPPLVRALTIGAQAEGKHEQLLEKLASLGITSEQFAHSEACHTVGCGACCRVEERLRAFEATLEHAPQGCWCGRQHVDTRPATPAPPPNNLAMSYAPRRRPWES